LGKGFSISLFGYLYSYDLTTQQEPRPFRFGSARALNTSICFSHDGRTLACCANTKDKDDPKLDKGELRLIEVHTGQVRGHLKGGVYGGIYGGCAGWSSRRMAVCLATTETKQNSDDNIPTRTKVIVIDTATGKRVDLSKLREESISPCLFSRQNDAGRVLLHWQSQIG